MQLIQSIDDLEQNSLCGMNHTRAPYDCCIDVWHRKKKPEIDRSGEKSQKLQAMTGDDGDSQLKGDVRISACSYDQTRGTTKHLSPLNSHLEFGCLHPIITNVSELEEPSISRGAL